MKPANLARQDQLMLGLSLLIALVYGVIYTFLMPPWQHYDEPNHFEYVWMAANLDRLPAPKDYDPKLSRMVLKSMLSHGFFDHLSYKPVIGPPSEKRTLPGYTQLSEPPLYYWLASVPLRLIPDQGVTVQLYAVRLVSTLFLLITVLSSWGIACELAPAGHPLRGMLPLTIAMTPAFVDLMSAVNNDVLAVAVASLFLWMGVRLLRRGFAWLEFVGLSLMGILTYFVKNTAMIVLVAYPFTLLFSLLRGRWRVVAWAILAASLVAGVAVSLRWDDPLGWYRDTSQTAPTRINSEQAVLGSYIFALDVGAVVTPRWAPPVFQNLPMQIGKDLAGKWVTFGYWIWSDQDLRARSPLLKTTNKTLSENVSLTGQPAFYAFQALLPEDTDRLWIDLDPDVAGSSAAMIYYDGLVLVEGRRPVNEPPQFDKADGSRGKWGGQPFLNLLQNGSAELAGPRLSSRIDTLAARFLPDQSRPSLLLASLVDVQGSQDLYPTTLAHMFKTFWAAFGWGHVPLLGSVSYQILFLITQVGLAGALLGLIRIRSAAPWALIVTLALVVITSILLALTRGGAYLAYPRFYIAPARHIYPLIIPIWLLFCSGWLEIFHLVDFAWQRLVRHRSIDWQSGIRLPPDSAMRLKMGVYILFFLLLDCFSVVSIAQYYGLLGIR